MEAADRGPRIMVLLAGQSNMAGRGSLCDSCPSLSAPADSRIAVLGEDGSWKVPACHPLHRDKEKAGVGPGLSFAQAVIDFLPAGAQRLGLVPCAYGGSEIMRWAAPDGDLFNTAVAAVQRGRAAGGVLGGVLWHQGESDSGTEDDAAKYPSRLRNVLRDLARGCGVVDVPFVLGELAVHFFDPSDLRFQHADRINRAIIEVGTSSSAQVGVVSARGLAHNGDRVHFNACAADELGRRYAWRWLELTGHLHASLRFLAGNMADPPLLTATLAPSGDSYGGEDLNRQPIPDAHRPSHRAPAGLHLGVD